MVSITPCAVARAVAESPEALACLAAALAPYLDTISTDSTYLTIPEAAEWLRCKRQRVDDLLSSRRLTRYKEGARTLVLRAEVEALPTAMTQRRASDTRVTPSGQVPMDRRFKG